MRGRLVCGSLEANLAAARRLDEIRQLLPRRKRCRRLLRRLPRGASMEKKNMMTEVEGRLKKLDKEGRAFAKSCTKPQKEEVKRTAFAVGACFLSAAPCAGARHRPASQAGA